MAMTDCTVRGSASITISGTFPPEGVTGELNDTIVGQNASQQMTSLTFGTTSGKCDLIVCQDRTLSATTAYTYDLYVGTDLKDVDHNTAAFRYVRAIGIFIVSGGDATGVRIGGAASNIWAGFFADSSDKHLIFPSGLPYLGAKPAGIAVGSSTKNLKIENLSAVSVVVRIVIAGSSV